eukprot:118013-Hanusia_phi.AAC.1
MWGGEEHRLPWERVEVQQEGEGQEAAKVLGAERRREDKFEAGGGLPGRLFNPSLVQVSLLARCSADPERHCRPDRMRGRRNYHPSRR